MVFIKSTSLTLVNKGMEEKDAITLNILYVHMHTGVIEGVGTEGS